MTDKEAILLKTFEEFLKYSQTLHGVTLLTNTREKPFKVSVEGKNLFFVPSSGKRRRANATKTERVLTLLADSNDWSPGTYQGITFHASYILQVVRHWRDHPESH